MATKKHIKSLKKSTTKSKDLPESIQWLLDFANIDSKSGELFPEKVVGLPIIKRPPAEPAPLAKDQFKKIIDGVSSILSPDEKSYIEKILNKSLCKDENDIIWTKQDDGSLNYRGALNSFPQIEVFRQFLSKRKITVDPQVLSMQKEYLQYILCWRIARISLLSKMNFGNEVDVSGYIAETSTFILDAYKFPYPKGKKYHHDNTLSQVICAYIQDFWYNYKELHQHLKQCGCCGLLSVETPAKGIRGRKKKYCSKECKDKFNQASRKANKDSKANSRRCKKEQARKKIIDWLCEVGFTRKEAMEEYEKEKCTHPNNVASLKSFQNSYGRRFGLFKTIQ